MYRWLLLGALLAACGDNQMPNETGDDAAVPGNPRIVAPATLTVVEGDHQSFLVTLTEDPRRDITIAVASRDEATATIGTPSITLTSANYAIGEQVTVLGTEDDGDVVNDMATIELSIDGVVQKRIDATVFDNDVQQIVVDTSSLTIDEGGTGTFTARLARQPAATVVAMVTSDAPATAAPMPSTLTFMPADYAVPQTVTVSAPADSNTANGATSIHVGDVATALTQSVHVDVIDHDVQSLLISTTHVDVLEGATATFTVALAYDPQTTLYLQVQSSDSTTASVAASSLAFDSTNYSTPHVVTITGSDDSDRLNETATITLAGTYTGSVSVAVKDDDDIIATGPITMFEGRTATVSVHLANDPGPSGQVVDIGVVSGNLMTSTSSLTFTTADYATDQVVQVYAPVDPSASSTSATVRASYPGQTPRDVGITIYSRSNAGTIQSITLTHENFFADATGWLDLTFTPDTLWPGDGRLVITFPAGYDLSAAALVSTTADGMLAISSATTSTITLVRSGGTTLYNPASVTIRLGGIHNPIVPGSYAVTVTTQTSAGDTLDQGTKNDGISAVYMPNATITLADLAPGATGNATATFTTVTSWPGDGAFEIYFPIDFDVSNVTFVSQTGADGTFTAAMSAPYRVRISRTGGTTLPGGSQVSLTVGNITNPVTARATTMFEAMTESSTGTWINQAFPKGVTIGCPATMTKQWNRASNVPFGGDAWWTGLTSAGLLNFDSSDFLVLDDFQFSMPAGATVAGIRFDVDRRTTSGWPVVDTEVHVVKGGTIGTAVDEASSAQWPWYSYATTTYGGATDVWGQTWSAADIESSTFGIAIAAHVVMAGNTSSVDVGHATATVYLSCP